MTTNKMSVYCCSVFSELGEDVSMEKNKLNTSNPVMTAPMTISIP